VDIVAQVSGYVIIHAMAVVGFVLFFVGLGTSRMRLVALAFLLGAISSSLFAIGSFIGSRDITGGIWYAISALGAFTISLLMFGYHWHKREVAKADAKTTPT
jgi:hypothetical protein